MTDRPTRRFLVAVALCALLLPSLACGAGSGSDESTEQNYSPRTVRWGSQCNPFVEVAGGVFRPDQEPCLELILQGYYTEGTLHADWYLGQRHLGRADITFNGGQALMQRLASGEATSRVTFPMHVEGGQLPPSDDYRVVISRNGTQVDTRRFRVVP